MRGAFRRQPVAAAARQAARVKTFPAPTRGWVRSENLATPRAAGAYVLENWRPTPTGIRLRGGSTRHATLQGGGVVLSLMSYDAAGVQRFFAATAGSIYDVTAPASATVPTAPTATGFASGDWSSALMSTAGGGFMLCVNGFDDAQLYDGTAFQALNAASTPAITGVDTDRLSDVWVYRNRVFFIEGGTLKAWFLPVDSVGGAASDLSLAGVFRRGGSLLFGATWSLDAGDGIDDKVVFVSDVGEAAIYEGGNPADPNDWRLVGVYDIGRPLGKRAWTKGGGDLLIATVEGVVAISTAINKDRAALSLASVSRPIAPEWAVEANARPLPWDMVKWSAEKIAYVALPTPAGQQRACFVVHLETGAWGKYVGWDMRSLGLYRERIYFGTSDGKVMLAENGGTDDGMPYVCKAVGLFDHFGTIGPVKCARQARATFIASKAFIPQVSASANYSVAMPAPPPSASDGDLTDLWDVGLWDDAKWDQGTAASVQSKWVSIGRYGYTLAWQVQVTCGTVTTPDAELVSIDMTYEAGGLVV